MKRDPEEIEEHCEATRHEIAGQLANLRKAFVALGNETRQAIMCALLTSERIGLRVGEIQESTHLSRPAVSHHLQVLKDAGLVAMQRSGRMNYYYAAADSVVWRSLAHLTATVARAEKDARDNGYPRLDSWEEEQ